MDKKEKMIIGFGVLVAVLVLIFVPIIIHRNDYSVVYLSTGEVYIGKLCTISGMTLKDGYLLQIVTGENGASNFQLAPLKESVWSPDKLKLNRDEVVFHGYLREDAKIMEALNNKVTE